MGWLKHVNEVTNRSLIEFATLDHQPQERRWSFGGITANRVRQMLYSTFDLKVCLGLLDHILAWYSRSLDCRNYDALAHPAFEDYARGVMASDHAPGFIKKDEELQKRFPPRPLACLNNAMVWDPPRTRKRCRRKKARATSQSSTRE